MCLDNALEPRWPSAWLKDLLCNGVDNLKMCTNTLSCFVMGQFDSDTTFNKSHGLYNAILIHSYPFGTSWCIETEKQVFTKGMATFCTTWFNPCSSRIANQSHDQSCSHISIQNFRSRSENCITRWLWPSQTIGYLPSSCNQHPQYSLLLGASNFAMQCLSGSIREDDDRAHQKKDWLDIGILSFRNLPEINSRRALLWSFLMVSSLPLQSFSYTELLLIRCSYNSIIYSSIYFADSGIL